ncbi:hypothetical protein GCM10010129_82260 [Streptomyces fumigatiscleroticus]|nr:hypothetical protein GCM10010129_82260 [Streptomyces fumigatiscleroticus]
MLGESMNIGRVFAPPDSNLVNPRYRRRYLLSGSSTIITKRYKMKFWPTVGSYIELCSRD